MSNAHIEGVLDNPGITVKTFKFVEIGRKGPLGGIRAIVDEQDMMVYFVANEGDSDIDGQIVAQRLDTDELYEFRQTGALRLMSGKSDIWDEEAMWNKGFDSLTMAIQDKAYMIGVYLRKECDYPSIRAHWDTLLNLYNSGMAILSDISQQIVVLSLIPEVPAK